MIKINKKYRLKDIYMNSMDADTDDEFYSIIEIPLDSHIFHIDLVYGGVGCCDDGCGTPARVITTDIGKAIEVATSDVVVNSEIHIQFKELNSEKSRYGILLVDEILSAFSKNGKKVYLCNGMDNSKIFIGISDYEAKEIEFKKLYKRDINFYWKK
jgi:replication-associated recombination protein RarA